MVNGHPTSHVPGCEHSLFTFFIYYFYWGGGFETLVMKVDLSFGEGARITLIKVDKKEECDHF